MSMSIAGRTWDDASSPAVARLVRRFEEAWSRGGGRRPEPADFLPIDSRERPAALLALLRADIALRWGAGDRVRVEWYRSNYPALDVEGLVALLYEEYCLLEESGEPPDPAGFYARFPEAAPLLRKVLEIHGLVGSGQTSTLRSRGEPAIAFPEAGQTIAGFRLVEELGRGAFARVFRAEERQLADRPVALKVARAGSREPQTLARLQHTHIVPVYSYRTDPVTGLHLLCMPYLGRVTLAQVLADEAIRSAGSGADLIAMLDRLQPLEAAPSAWPVGKAELRRRSYPRAVAWWAARLAEALQHAHDRGVMHRDVKPSNVLITADATPMLLDFNLAQERWIDDLDVAPAVLGGTLAYMAPEHLDALAEGVPDRVAGRSDLFALGVVVFEMLARGVRPFANPSGAATVAEALRRAADERRGDVPRLRAAHPEVSSALEAVVRRCLAPDPTDRYTSAADLAADLQAVADDRPPRFAREPLASRSVRWLRHNRRRLALAALMSLALTILSGNLVNARLARFRLEADVKLWISEGEHAIREDHPEVAAQQFATAAQLAASDPGLRGLRDRASRLSDHARRIKAVRDKADELFRRDEPLRFRLFGDLGDPKIAREIKAALRLFDVPDNPRWARQPDLALLDEGRRTRLLDEINQMLFLWVVSLDGVRPEDPGRARQALAICDAAEGSTAPIGPWRALHERYRAPLDGKPSPRAVDLPARETSARACFQWGMLRHMEDRDDAAIAWLERAVQLKPDDYWSQFCLAFLHYRARHVQEALDHYNQAVVLRPEVPWARFNRALLHHERGDWEKELDDLDRALATARDVHSDYPQARLGLGLLLQYLGDVDGARKAYDAVIASGSPLARAARFNRAKLDFDTGQIDHAQAELDALVAEAPIDPAPRLARALLALRLGAADRAESDLTYLLRNDPRGRPERLAHRAQARLALGRPAEAEEDAEASLRLEWTPGRERLWIRTLLALRRGRDLVVFDRPEDVALMPAGGPALRADLRAAAEQLRGIPGDVDPLAHRACAVLLSALDDPTAEIEASRAVALLPGSADAYLIRARVRRRRGDRHGALEDVDRGLDLEPNAPRLLELRGLLETELGYPKVGLIDLDRAIHHGAAGTVHAPRAATLMALGRLEPARDAWSRALAYDPEDPLAYLGRARVALRLRQVYHAIADLEQAADWAGDHPGLMARITLTYVACLPRIPGRLPRVLSLARRTWVAWLANTGAGRGP